MSYWVGRFIHTDDGEHGRVLDRKVLRMLSKRQLYHVRAGSVAESHHHPVAPVQLVTRPSGIEPSRDAIPYTRPWLMGR